MFYYYDIRNSFKSNWWISDMLSKHTRTCIYKAIRVHAARHTEEQRVFTEK